MPPDIQSNSKFLHAHKYLLGKNMRCSICAEFTKRLIFNIHGLTADKFMAIVDMHDTVCAQLRSEVL